MDEWEIPPPAILRVRCSQLRIRWVDRHVHGGWGVMVDDAIAAIFSWVLVQLAVGAATFSLLLKPI